MTYVFYERENGTVREARLNSNQADGVRAADGTGVLSTSVYRDGRYVKTNTSTSSTSVAQSAVYKLGTVTEGEEGSEVDKEQYAVNDDQLAKITWSVSGRAAYPATLDGIGGKIIVATYGQNAPFYFEKSKYQQYKSSIKDYLKLYLNEKSDWKINSSNLKLIRPDNSMSEDDMLYSFSNTEVSAVPTGYTYNRTADKLWNLKNTSGNVYENWYGATGNESGEKVLLRIKKGSEFDIRYLPLLTVAYDWDVEYFMNNPWYKNKDDKILGIPTPNAIFYLIFKSLFGDGGHVTGTQKASIVLPWQDAYLTDELGNLISVGDGNGFTYIDTSSTANKYILCLDNVAVGDSVLNLKVHINIVA